MKSRPRIPIGLCMAPFLRRTRRCRHRVASSDDARSLSSQPATRGTTAATTVADCPGGGHQRIAGDIHTQFRRQEFLIGIPNLRDLISNGRPTPLETISLIAEMNSLFLIMGNSPSMVAKLLGNADPDGAGRAPGFRILPRCFPAGQGFDRRDEFPLNFPLRHPGCGCRDRPQLSKFSARSSRDSAGFWRLGSSDFEPETASLRFA